MVKRRETRNTNSKTSLRIWLLAGASSVALTAGVVILSTRTVHADAPLPRPAITAPPTAPAQSATPVLAAPHKKAERTAETPTPAESAETATEHALHGVASWYGGKFHGRRTASGERYDMYAMTACHPTLPFGTVVRVVNRENNRAVVVRITDRGYLYSGRILDLSYGAARKLAMIKPGLAQVDIEVLSLGQPRHRK
jgi:rare lipoprotein A